MIDVLSPSLYCIRYGQDISNITVFFGIWLFFLRKTRGLK